MLGEPVDLPANVTVSGFENQLGPAPGVRFLPTGETEHPCLLTVKSGEDVLKVSASPRLFPEPDSTVWLRLEPNRIRWMDPETGSAVEPAAAVAQSVNAR